MVALVKLWCQILFNIVNIPKIMHQTFLDTKHFPLWIASITKLWDVKFNGISILETFTKLRCWNLVAFPYCKHSPNSRIWWLSILELLTKLCHQNLMRIPHRILPLNFDAKVWWGFQVGSSHQIHQSLMGMPRFGWDSLLFYFHFLRFHNHCLIISIVSMQISPQRKWILWLQTSQPISWCLMYVTWHFLSPPRIRVSTTLLILSFCFLTNSCSKMEMCCFSMSMTCAC